MSQLFPWERFWIPIQSTVDHVDDNGFLYDLKNEHPEIFNSDILKFSDIKNKQCLILLGEPGIGKSVTLENEKNKARQDTETQGHLFYYLNLNTYNDQYLLDKYLFENQTFKQYCESTTHILHL